MNLPTRRVGAALAALLLVTPALVACGEDDSEATRTTHTVPTSQDPGATPNPGDPEVDPAILAEIEQRGAPTPEPVEGPVEELQIIDEVEGTGPDVAPGAVVTAHYVGVVAATGEKFDASWERGEPTTFSLSQVIEGWTEGLPGMKVGGRRTLVIPAEMAYGATPPPGSGIPADAPLIFTVDMVAAS